MTCPFVANQGGCPHGTTRQIFCMLRWWLWLRRTLVGEGHSVLCGICMRHRLHQLKENSAETSESPPSDHSSAPAA